MNLKRFFSAALFGAACAMAITSAVAQQPIYLPYQGDLLSQTGPVTLIQGTTNGPGVTNLPAGQKVLLLHPRTSIAFFPYLLGSGGVSSSNVTFQLAVSPWYQTNRGAYLTNLVVNAGTSMFCTVSNSTLQISVAQNGTNSSNLLMGASTLNYTNWDGSIAMELLSILNYGTNATPPVVSNLFYSFQAPQP